MQLRLAALLVDGWMRCALVAGVVLGLSVGWVEVICQCCHSVAVTLAVRRPTRAHCGSWPHCVTIEASSGDMS